MKLTNTQIKHLHALTDGKRSAYPSLHMGSLEALERRGLVIAQRSLGSIAMPHTSIQWLITRTGRLALSACEREGGEK
jgi:hypothetical protein